MAKKRPEFSFPELEHRGRNAILRSSAEVQAEEALLAETGSDATTPDSPDGDLPSPPFEVDVQPARRVTRRSSAVAESPAPESSAASHDSIDDAPRTERASTSAPVRARTRVPKAGVSGGPSSVVTDRLRQKLRTKQHLSSYTFRFRPEELEQLDQLVAELNLTRSTKLSKNDLVRLALGWLLTDYEEYGPASLVVEVTQQE
jgi:hypothetical protein